MTVRRIVSAGAAVAGRVGRPGDGPGCRAGESGLGPDLDVSRPRRPVRVSGSARRWPTTRPPARSCCSAGSARRGGPLVTPGPGTARPGPSSTRWSTRLPGTGGDGLRRSHRQRRAVRRPPAERALSATPGPGTARPGPSRPPPAHPAARDQRLMAYDAATGNVVLFGGSSHGRSSVTPGPGTARPGPSSTRRSPASPVEAAMAYDAATGTVVLFGGQGPAHRYLWRHLDLGRHDLDRQPPAGHPRPGTAPRWPTTRPPARWCCSAASTATLLATPGPGTARPGPSRPRPPPRARGAVMADDAATGNVVLFGGADIKLVLDDTWTWG